MKHAYLESLLHKAFRPLFSEDFLNEFIAANEFRLSEIKAVDFEMWNAKAMQSPGMVASLKTLLGKESFLAILQNIYVVTSSLKPVMLKTTQMVEEDVILESIFSCRVLCNVLYNLYDPELLKSRVGSCEHFALLVYSLQPKKRPSYFKFMNEMVEEMERMVAILESNTKIFLVSALGYDRMYSMAQVLLGMSSSVGVRLTGLPTVFKERSVPYTEGVLRLANYAHYNELRVFAAPGSTEDVETMITNISRRYLNLISMSLRFWLSPRLEDMFQKILARKLIRPPTFKPVEGVDLRAISQSFYALPLSVIRVIEGEDANGRLNISQIISLVHAAKAYRVMVREAHRVGKNKRKQTAVISIFYSFYGKLVPDVVYDIFKRHIDILKVVIDVIEVPHISSFLSNGSGIDYFQKLPWWVAQVTKYGMDERKLEVLIKFVMREVDTLMPCREEAKVTKLTLALMIDGGLDEYLRNHY